MMRVAILGSGRGSNARAILEAQTRGELGMAQVAGIFCDNPDAGILELGPSYEVPAFYLHPGRYRTKLGEEQELHWIEIIRKLSVDLIVLAGFMRVIKRPFLDAFPEAIINLHPSLLPKFPGLNSIRRAWEANEPVTGCTVHWVSEEIDAGQIIAQEKVPIVPGMSLAELEHQVHAAEHRLLPSVIADIAARLYAATYGIDGSARSGMLGKP